MTSSGAINCPSHRGMVTCSDEPFPNATFFCRTIIETVIDQSIQQTVKPVVVVGIVGGTGVGQRMSGSIFTTGHCRGFQVIVVLLRIGNIGIFKT